jgi:hypothetical protein
MKEDIKVLNEVLDIICRQKKQINLESAAARQDIATKIVHELEKRKSQININYE